MWKLDYVLLVASNPDNMVKLIKPQTFDSYHLNTIPHSIRIVSIEFEFKVGRNAQIETWVVTFPWYFYRSLSCLNKVLTDLKLKNYSTYSQVR